MIKKKKYWMALGAIFSFPIFVFAETTIKGILEEGTVIVVLAINLMIAMAFAVFIWGIVKFIAAAGSPKKIKTAKSLIIYGLIGIFVLISFRGIIALMENTVFGTSSQNNSQSFDLGPITPI